MQIETILGHSELLQGLWKAAARGRLAHALLFDGPAGIGKFEAAKVFAQGLLCSEGPGQPCGECGPCKRVRSGGWRGNHPDLYRIDPVEENEETIKLGRVAVREGNADCAEGFLRLKAIEQGWRIVLIREADRAQLNTQNSMLKTLEEPGHQTLLILETARPDRLLDTIRSRMVKVPFRSLSAEDTRAVLHQHGLDDSAAAELARWSQGSPGVALGLASQGAVELRRVLSAALDGQVPALTAAAESWSIEGEFAGKTARAVARTRAKATLDMALALLGDARSLAAGVPPETLRHGDLGRVLRGALKQGEAALSARQEAVLQSRADLDANLGPEGAVDRGLLAMVGTGF